jgi:hypothetical protein
VVFISAAVDEEFLRELERSNRIVARGVEILRLAQRSRDPEVRLFVHHVKELARNARQISDLEQKLEIKPANRWRAAFDRNLYRIFHVVGVNNSLLRKGDHNLVFGNVWETILQLKKLSVQRRQELGTIKMQRKRATKVRLEKLARRAAKIRRRK